MEPVVILTAFKNSIILMLVLESSALWRKIENSGAPRHELS
jgi:hypothetical protein